MNKMNLILNTNTTYTRNSVNKAKKLNIFTHKNPTSCLNADPQVKNHPVLNLLNLPGPTKPILKKILWKHLNMEVVSYVNYCEAVHAHWLSRTAVFKLGSLSPKGIQRSGVLGFSRRAPQFLLIFSLIKGKFRNHWFWRIPSHKSQS